VLPTDPRYKELTPEQIELLFYSFLNTPSDEEYKYCYRRRKQKVEAAENVPDWVLKKMKYTDEEIKELHKELSDG